MNLSAHSNDHEVYRRPRRVRGPVQQGHTTIFITLGPVVPTCPKTPSALGR